MEQDRFYDSLEEDDFLTASSSSLAASKSKSSANIVVIKSPPQKGEQEQDEPAIDISTVVPLYEGDKQKCELTPSKKSSSSSHFSSHKDKQAVKGAVPPRAWPKKRSKFSGNYSIVDKLAEVSHVKSYLNMFHSRIGYLTGKGKKGVEDTVRSVFGDTKRSMISEVTAEGDQFQDAKDCDSDETSYYLEHIRQAQDGQEKCPKSTSRSTSTVGSNNTPQSPPPPPSPPFQSVSQITTASSKSSFMYSKYKISPTPILGGLGRDTTDLWNKQERRRKQLCYGQRAHERNKIRQIESKLLRDLKREIEKSKEANNSLISSQIIEE